MKKNQLDAEKAIREAAANWKGDLLTRGDVVLLTGKAFTTNHLANLDCQGNGPAGSFTLGRKRIYPKNQVVEWLLSRLEI